MDDLNSSLRRARTRMVPPEPAFDRLLDRRRRKQRNSRIASMVVAFAVMAGGIAGAVVAFGGGHERHAPNRVTDGGPTLVAKDGQYYYSRTQIYAGDEPCDGCAADGVYGPWTLELWYGPDASGRVVFVDKKGPTGSIDYGQGDEDRTYAPGQMPGEDLSGMSADPDELRAQLTQRSLPGGASPNPIPTTSPGRTQVDTSLLRTMQDLFDGGEQFVPPLIRATMFEVAQGITGVETIPGEVDPVGRPAIGLRWVIQYEGPPNFIEWYFDPETKLFMAETWTQHGHVLLARIVTEAGIAGSTDDLPRREDLFFPSAQGTPSFAQ